MMMGGYEYERDLGIPRALKIEKGDSKSAGLGFDREVLHHYYW